MDKFPERLKSLRLANNKTQKEISEKLNIHTNSYQKYELAQRLPTLIHMYELADYFDVSTDYLLGRTDNPNSHKL